MASEKKTTFANPLILGFLFHKRAHIQYKKKTWALCSGSSGFLCHFTFNKNLRSLQYIKYFYFRLQLSLVFYYPWYAIVSTSLGSCMQMGNWTGSSFHYSQQLAQSVVLCVFPASCWKKIDVLILFSIFLQFWSLQSFLRRIFTLFSWSIWEQSHSFEDPLTDTIERGTCL